MNNKKLSVFMVVLTVFCVGVIFYSDKKVKDERNAYEKTEGENITRNSNSKTVGKANNKVDNGNTANSSGIEQNKTQSKNKTVNSDKSKNTNGNSNSVAIKTEEQVEDQSTLDKKDTAVFKVSKGDIQDMLSLSDKQKIFAIAIKLSASDYSRIKGYLEDGDDESIVKALRLLKDRLSEKDYEKLKTVADKFVNMDVVEGK